MLNILSKYFINLPGWHTNRKIVVFESDDWGSIRMPSLKIRERLSKFPLINVEDPYNRYDTLASVEDLTALFDILFKYKDKNGNHPKITANCVVSNPDFEAIRLDKFENYHYENLEQTFQRYNKTDALTLWNEGLKASIFIPQFHGREHVNVPFWLNMLQNNHAGVKQAFDSEVFGACFKGLGLRKSNFQAAWDFDTNQQENETILSIQEGLDLFERQFNFTSTTVTPPSYTWSLQQEKALYEKGVKSIQTMALQKWPIINSEKYKRKFRYTKPGNKKIGYTLRNVFFEPTLHQHKDQLPEIIQRMGIAFKMQKPVIIGCHRLNFIGGLDEQNRTKSLKEFEVLLKTVLKKWPDVEFMSSPELVGEMA